MTSSMLAGERRWASTRRSSMTVLGKVAVPKPLNLPSQRLENHGVDPNVEIVPKGSLSWGSRPSSSGSNPWGSSALSPNADNVSPSNLSGRPSSGGSGTRPSTAGSDRMHEPTTNAWGPNSRPSSASGSLTSNQTSLASLRPRSAETRPGSSQLSRFAEASSDSSVAWGGTGTVEKLVFPSSKNDGFSLSSGDFPTLGSQKDNSGKNSDSQDHGSHGRPSSSSGRLVQEKESTDVNGRIVNTWRIEGTQHVEDGVQPSADKWQVDPQQQYLNASVPPHHFDAWHGPPINAPAGVWFRGPPPPGGPPYPPVAPGGFPMEPFPYYHPQFPPPALTNSQPVPPLGAGTVPRGHHPRPQMPDGYMHPGMPIRPGFHPGPVAYESYYGPPMGYYNSNERDVPYMGVAAAPSVHHRYPAQNAPDPSNIHARAGGRGPTSKAMVIEQVETGHSAETRGPYKVLIKQHNEWVAKEEEENRGHTAPANANCLEKGDQPRTALRENEWGADNRRDAEMYPRNTSLIENNSSRNYDNRGGYSSDYVMGKSPPDSMGKRKVVDDSWRKKSENAAPSVPEVLQVLPATPPDSTVIQKIKDMNVKARASEGGRDVISAPSGEDQKKKELQVNAKSSTLTNEGGVSTGDAISKSTAASGTVISRRVDHRSKGRFNNPDADGWQKKSLVAESSSAVSAANVFPASSVQAQSGRITVEATEKSSIDVTGKDEGESLTPLLDPSDGQAQRAKMRELAKQRAIQLQKEEEERIREQKAKALAKLEELNRRTKAGDGSIQKLEKAPPSGAVQCEQEESRSVESVVAPIKHETPSTALVSKPNVVVRTNESSISGIGEFTVLSRDSHVEARIMAQQETIDPHEQSLPSKPDAHNAVATDSKPAPQVSDGNVSRSKRTSYKQKQNIQVEKNSTEKSIPTGTAEAPKSQTVMVVNDTPPTEVVTGDIGSSFDSNLAGNSNMMSETSTHQRKKNNRSNKNKHKLDEASPPTETNVGKASTESGKKASQIELDPSPVQSVSDVKDAIQSSEQHCLLPTEETHGKAHNQWKAQQSRRMPRNPQANRSADKYHVSDAVMWAPVRSHNKAEATEIPTHKAEPDAVTTTAKNNTNVVQSIPKSKRAEMERYVPKPVAKEYAQHGSIQQPIPPLFGQTTSDEAAGRSSESGLQSNEISHHASSGSGKGGSLVESKNGDGKQNKQTIKAHGAWRQRGPAESLRVQDLQQGSSSALNSRKNVQKSVDQHISSKPDVISVKAEPVVSDEWDPSDGWNMPPDPEYPTTVAPVTAVVKDQGGAKGKGQRLPYKGSHRNTGNNHDLDHKNSSSGESHRSYSHSASLEISQTDGNPALKDSRGSSHWQPKSQAPSHQRGNRSSGGRHVTAEVDTALKKDFSHQQDKEGSEIIPQLHPEHSVSENDNNGKAPTVGHQEVRRERRTPSSRGRPYSPNQGVVSTDESAAGVGFRKNGSHNNRSGRDQESHGDWSSAGPDNRQHNVPAANREQRGQNSNYKYQTSGSYNNNKSNNFEGPTDGSRGMSSRYRERGQGQGSSRRGGGNFYGRHSGSFQADAGYD